MAGQQMTEVDQERDWGILITKDLKCKHQKEASYRKDNRALAYIYRNFHYKLRDIVLPLYTSLVKPHMAFSEQFLSPHLSGDKFWSPHLSGDINNMERAQHRATNIIPEMKSQQTRQVQTNIPCKTLT